MIVNLFAGAGGWDVALRNLGRTAVGIDNNKDACATRVKAGFAMTMQSDTTTCSDEFILDTFGTGIEGLIASPPCQSFSSAGKRKGLDDPRGQLIFEVMRWARILKPTWIACENVPAALPIWQKFELELMELGYATWSKVLHAEQYGVPQTRSRAILLASRVPFTMPEPTHSRYYQNEPDRLDIDVKPWASWGEALRRFGEVGAFELRHTRGKGMIDRYGDRPHRKSWQPSFTVSSKARSWVWHVPGDFVFRKPERVTIEEASLFQTFPADYPWRGSRSSIFQQIGNGIPPLFAEAILRSVIC